jgi:hypothetical protein
MSDTWLQLVATDPEWTPEPEPAHRCVETLKGFFPGAHEVTAQFEASVSLFDAGCNLETISCPACGLDAGNWWLDAMDKAWETQFADLEVTTPCCGLRTSLNDLRYHWPVAFGRFALVVLNPNSEELSQDQHQDIERCLGMRLRTVWRHI